MQPSNALNFQRAKIMAVINVTPDSFFSGSRVVDDQEFLAKIENAIHQGADILDIGAVSTRPGSEFVSLDEERKRLMSKLDLIAKHFPNFPVSVDTYRTEIARLAYDYGATIINDVSNASDLELLKFCADKNLHYVLMHMRGTPNNMMEHTGYVDVVEEVFSELKAKIETLKMMGIKKILIDPGFGFSKTLEQNYQLMQRLERFHDLGFPLFIGVSRKSMIYKLLEIDANSSLNGSTVLHTVALMKGAHILRVHDVKEAVECRTLVEGLKG